MSKDDYRYIRELLTQYEDRYNFMLKHRKNWSPVKIADYRQSLYILKLTLIKEIEEIDN